MNGLSRERRRLAGVLQRRKFKHSPASRQRSRVQS